MVGRARWSIGRRSVHAALALLSAATLAASFVDTAQAAPSGGIQLAAGDGHACVLLHLGAIRCWGDNRSGQLGQGDTANRGDNPGQLGDTLRPVDLGAGRAVVDLATGDNHTCAILDDAAVKCWGAGGLGRLGLGDTDNRGDDLGELGDALPRVDLGSLRLVDGIVPTARATAVTGIWRTAPIPVHVSATDLGGSGLRVARYAVFADGDPVPDPFGAAGKTYDAARPPVLHHGERLVYAVQDGWGNRSISRTTGAARVDSEPPVTTDDVPSTPQARPHAVTLTAHDERSGVAEIRYTVGVRPADPTGPQGRRYDPSSKPLLAPGERIRYSAVDVAGNVEPPRASAALPPAPAADDGARGDDRRPANLAPIVKAVLRRVATRRRATVYALDASRSVDPDGRIVRWRWQIDGRTVATVARARVRLPKRRAPHRVTLTVTDDGGATSVVRMRTASDRRVKVMVRTAYAYRSPRALTPRVRRLLLALRPQVERARRLRVIDYARPSEPARRGLARARRLARHLLRVRSAPRGVIVERRPTRGADRWRIVVAIAR